MRVVLPNILMIALATVLLGHFSLIAAWGEVTIYEPNLVILGFEMACLLAIIGFGLYNLMKR